MLGGGTAMEAVCAGCAGVDARMGGAPLAAMSNSGSGNQGVTCTAPVAAAGGGWAGAMKRSCGPRRQRIC